MKTISHKSYHNYLKTNAAGYIFLITVSFFSFSCSERTIDPFEDNSKNYSVYGVLDVTQPVNYIRVREFNNFFLADSSQIEKFDVYLEDVEQNSVSKLPSTTVDFNGNTTLNYEVSQSFEPRSSYTLSVEGKDGKYARSTATTPGITSHHILRTEQLPCRFKNRISFINVREPEFIRMEIGFFHEGQLFWSELGEAGELVQSQFGDTVSVEANATYFLIDVFGPTPATEQAPIQFQVPSVSCTQVDEKTIYIRYIHFGPEWDVLRKNGFDAFEILESGAIENGNGFFGAINRGAFEFEFTVD